MRELMQQRRLENAMKSFIKFFVIFAMINTPQIVKAGLADRLDGVWTGEVRQNGLATTYPVRFTAENGVYSSQSSLREYPFWKCSGTLTVLSETSGSVTFIESVQEGKSYCIDRTKVEVLFIENNKLRYIVYLPNGDIEAYGELECSSCSINANNAVFRNGVLHIPNVDVLDRFGGSVTYEANLSLIPSSTPLTFEVIDARRK